MTDSKYFSTTRKGKRRSIEIVLSFASLRTKKMKLTEQTETKNVGVGLTRDKAYGGRRKKVAYR